MKHIFVAILLFPFLAFSQCIHGDCKSGSGEYKFKGAFYLGEFLEGEIHGEGVFATKKGYSYNGTWKNGFKEGFGVENFKKGYTYKGNFSKNRRHGYGAASIEATRFMTDINYSGNWFYGSICGKGELSYSREVTYGRNKLIETNKPLLSSVPGLDILNTIPSKA